MRLQEQGKTEQARKDLGNWLLSVHYFSFQSTELMFSVIHNPIIYILLATC